MTDDWKSVRVDTRKVLEVGSAELRVAWYLIGASPEWLELFRRKSSNGVSVWLPMPAHVRDEERAYRESILRAIPEIEPAPKPAPPAPEIVDDHIEWSFAIDRLEEANDRIRRWIREANVAFPNFGTVLEWEAEERAAAGSRRLADLQRYQRELDALPYWPGD
jgi:hypothetical protein